MKIVSIAWYKVLPPVFGGQKGIAFFNQELGKKIPLVCLCSKNNTSNGDLSYKLLPELPVSKSQFINPVSWSKIIRTTREEAATHLILEHPNHGIAGLKAAKRTGAKLVLHAHNIETERFRIMGKWWWRLLFYYERWVSRKARLIIYKTQADQDWAVKHFNIDSSNCMIIPFGIKKPVRNTGANAIIRLRHTISDHEKIILFAGTLDYQPNAMAVEAIYKILAKQIEAQRLPYKIIICGRNKDKRYKYLEQLTHPSVIRAGEVEDIENYFSAADLFINPVQTGSGIQTKNLEALSYDLAIVCFNHMLEGIDPGMTGEKIFSSPANDWGHFVINIKKALATTTITPVPPVFFEHYSFAAHIEKLAVRLNSL